MIYAAPPTYGDLLVVLSTWVLRWCAVWAASIVVAAVVEALTRGRVRATAWVAAPPVVRRALLAAVGALLAGSLPGPVSAAVGAPAPSTRPLPPPARTSGGPPTPGPALSRAVVTVRPGDTLWALAAARLPRGADDARVLEAVHRWYARNRAVIGPDPDLLLPGQHLRPATPQEER